MADNADNQREWTLMFYFASDNPLAPGIVSHLKALKNAGYHPRASVLAYFDPQTPGTPSHIFDVNAIDKLENPGESEIGFKQNDPFVRNLMLDKLWRDQTDRNGKPIRDVIQSLMLKRGTALTVPTPPDLPDTDIEINVVQPAGELQSRLESELQDSATKPEVDLCDDQSEPAGPEKSLGKFLEFCANEYPANHYMLFVIGHGQIVGDDVFMYDEHAAIHSLTLRHLGRVLRKFKNNKNVRDAQFDLVSFHSCSMSSLEIASELQGTANFMLASQGESFVGSWPYLSILIRVFNDLKAKTKIDVKETLKQIFAYIIHNCTDFILAGYSADLCLCELSTERVSAAENAVADLSTELMNGLDPGVNPLVKDCILLAHWKSQSYWQENYTDLYDFCLCLDSYCNELGKTIGNMGAIQAAAGRVMDALRPEDSSHPQQLVTMARFVGPASQYAHGLSVYFPWAEPSEEKPIMADYNCYQFQKKTKWLDFLKTYFAGTMRQSRRSEPDTRVPAFTQTPKEQLQEDMAAIMFNSSGSSGAPGTLASNDPGKTGPRDPMGQVGPRDPMGGTCTCGSVKNFPHDTRPRLEQAKGGPREDPSPLFFNF
ncbi:MAG: hypothetical protein JWM21_4645 [Acidobacteria bacterium]|nr:hypothetical protein [Acidobacteriota bacterium]